MRVSDNRCPCRVAWRVFLTVTHSAGLIQRNIGKLITRVGGQCTTHDAGVNLWKRDNSVLVWLNNPSSWAGHLLHLLSLLRRSRWWFTTSKEHSFRNGHARLKPFRYADPRQKHVIEIMRPGLPADRVWQHFEPAACAFLPSIIGIVVKSDQSVLCQTDARDPAATTSSTH